jgi:Arc/MetJ-type ribon-helix-helix transcriptional regulator
LPQPQNPVSAIREGRESYMPKSTPEKALEALRAALMEGESSGISTPFDFDAFIKRKRQEGNERQASAPKSR